MFLQDVVDEVYQLLQQHNLDWQQLRTWVRQLQQQKEGQQQPQQQVGADTASSSSGSSSDSDATDSIQEAAVAALHVQDDEVRQLMLELAQQPQRKQGSTTKGRGQSSVVTAARRSIRKMLKPLAVEHCK